LLWIDGKGQIQAVFGVGGVQFQAPVNSWKQAKQCLRSAEEFPFKAAKVRLKIDFISNVLSSIDYSFGVFSPEYVTARVTEIVPPSLVKQTGW
jgi:hypothetical protein